MLRYALIPRRLGHAAAPWAAARSLCLGPPPPFDDSYTKVPSLQFPAELHAMTSDQQDKGGTESIVASKPACIAFVSQSSPSCRSFGPTLDEIADAHPGVTFAKVDVDTPASAQLAEEQGVGRDVQLPVLKGFKNGLNMFTVTGGDAGALKAALADVDKTVS